MNDACIEIKLSNNQYLYYKADDGAPENLGITLATASFWHKDDQGKLKGQEQSFLELIASLATKLEGTNLRTFSLFYHLDLSDYTQCYLLDNNKKQRLSLAALNLLRQQNHNSEISDYINDHLLDCLYQPDSQNLGTSPVASKTTNAVAAEGDEILPTQVKWAQRYFAIAHLVSTWSKDPSTKVGAIIVGDKGQIISQGYNGFPRGVHDLAERYNHRETKYKFIVHAEMNAILNALYNGSSVVGASIYIHNLPVCQECAKAIIQSGIAKVYIDTKISERWQEAWKISCTMFREAGIEIYYFDAQSKRLSGLTDDEQ